MIGALKLSSGGLRMSNEDLLQSFLPRWMRTLEEKVRRVIS
jgi:hypothetical protein